MAESVDALVSNTSRFTPVPVRPRLWVLKTLVEQLLRGFLLFKTSKMVTFGHHFKNGGQKNGKKESKKMSKISLFEGGATNNNFYFLLDAEIFFKKSLQLLNYGLLLLLSGATTEAGHCWEYLVNIGAVVRIAPSRKAFSINLSVSSAFSFSLAIISFRSSCLRCFTYAFH